MRRTLLGLGTLALVFGFSCQGEQDSRGERSFGVPKLAVRLSEPQINESSGLARSHLREGWYFTHNDSGDTARYWCFDLSGKVEGPFAVAGAKAVDWEDMASAQIAGKSYVYFADIGDNAEKRAAVQVYRMEEGGSGRADVFDLKYPDGPHNAEAFMVDPGSGDFWIVTKAAKTPSMAFWLAAPQAAGPHTMQKKGDVPIGGAIEAGRLVTGGDISADGRFLVLRTYLSAYEFDFGPEWWVKKPRPMVTAAEVQGEAIAYSRDGKSLITSSEFSPCPVSVSRLHAGSP